MHNTTSHFLHIKNKTKKIMHPHSSACMHIFPKKSIPPFVHNQQDDILTLAQNLKQIQKNYGRVCVNSRSVEARSQQVERENRQDLCSLAIFVERKRKSRMIDYK